MAPLLLLILVFARVLLSFCFIPLVLTVLILLLPCFIFGLVSFVVLPLLPYLLT